MQLINGNARVWALKSSLWAPARQWRRWSLTQAWVTGPGPGGGLEKKAVVLIQQRTKLGQEMWGRQRRDQAGALVTRKLGSHSAALLRTADSEVTLSHGAHEPSGLLCADWPVPWLEAPDIQPGQCPLPTGRQDWHPSLGKGQKSCDPVPWSVWPNLQAEVSVQLEQWHRCLQCHLTGGSQHLEGRLFPPAPLALAPSPTCG